MFLNVCYPPEQVLKYIKTILGWDKQNMLTYPLSTLPTLVT